MEEKSNSEANIEEESAQAAEEEIKEKPGDGEESQPEEEETKKEKEKKGILKKEKKVVKDKKDQLIEEMTDKYKRTFAEFDNFRKRTEKEKASMYETGAKSIIEKILPIIDNFERGLATVSEEEKQNPFVDGMDKVYRQLLKALEEAGVTPIEALGKEFDPSYHNAVMHVEDESLGENIIAEEFQKGYMYRETVVRHSMVKVAN